MKSCGVIRAENNEQQVAGLDDWPKFFLAQTNRNSGQSNHSDHSNETASPGYMYLLVLAVI